MSNLSKFRAGANLMDFLIAETLQLTLEALPQPISVTALDGKLLCLVTHQTSPVMLIFVNGHGEKI